MDGRRDISLNRFRESEREAAEAEISADRRLKRFVKTGMDMVNSNIFWDKMFNYHIIVTLFYSF